MHRMADMRVDRQVPRQDSTTLPTPFSPTAHNKSTFGNAFECKQLYILL